MNKQKQPFIRNTLIVILLFTLSIIYFFPILKKFISIFDEGVILAGADRIMKGDVPFKDFWTIYSPGQYYILAWLFDIFGSSILVERIYDVIVKASLSMSVYFVVKKLSHSNKVAFVGWAMATVWIGHRPLAAYPSYPALLLAYLSVYYFLCHIEKDDKASLVYSAILTTASATFRHDVGAYTAVAIFSALIIRRLLGRKEAGRSIGCYLASYLILGVPILVYFLRYVDARDLINQLVFIPAEIMPKYRWLPYPALSFENRVFYVFPLVLVTGFVTFVLRILRNGDDEISIYGIFVVSFQGILFLNQVRVRSDIYHLLAAAISSAILIPVLWSYFLNRLTMNRMWMKITANIIAITCFLFLFPICDKVETISKDYFRLAQRTHLKRAGFAPINRELEKVVSYIQANTKENEPIYVGVKNHDQAIVNAPVIYYLSARNYATRFHHFETGVSNTSSAQKIIVQELEISSTRKLVLTRSYWREPNETANDLKIDILDNYINKNYKLEANFGGYEVWNRKL